MDVILSTNFDDLVERVFEASRNSLGVFEVHLQGGLPDWSAVSRVRALVKLHGSRHSLRADYSLDDEAPEPDKKRFLEYLMRGTSPAGQSSPSAAAQNHLLIMGVGGSERRTCSFIDYAWRNLTNFRVYWVCHTDEGVETVKNLYKRFQKSPDGVVPHFRAMGWPAAIRTVLLRPRRDEEPHQGCRCACSRTGSPPTK